MSQSLNVDGETGTFKLAFEELTGIVDTYSAVQGLLVPLLLAPRLNDAAYLLRIMILMEMRQRVVCMQRECCQIMLRNSQLEENGPVLGEALVVLEDTINTYLAGARECPEFFN